MIPPSAAAAIAAGLLVAAIGCATELPVAGRSAASPAERAGGLFAAPPGTLPLLNAKSQPIDYVRFALNAHPSIAVAWHDWRAAQAAVVPAKSLPDPQLTFEADIAATVMSLMPGVMFELMAPGKRAAMGREAAAGAEVARRTYASALVRVAAETRRALVELAYLDEAIQLREASVASAQHVGEFAASEYSSSRGMNTSLEAQVQAVGGAARLRSEIATLNGRHAAARARLKSSLGLLPSDADPMWPHGCLEATSLPSGDELWRRVQASNPDLATMRAMVEMAVAGVDVARRSGTPDFGAGLMIDVKQAPWMWRPTANLTLPIWRGKIRETITAAEARRQAAGARVQAEQLNMAAELARMLAMVREGDQMIEYIDDSALPNLQRTRATVASAYRTGAGGAARIAETVAMEIAMRSERLAALRERELAVVDLLAMTADLSAGAVPQVGTAPARP